MVVQLLQVGQLVIWGEFGSLSKGLRGTEAAVGFAWSAITSRPSLWTPGVQAEGWTGKWNRRRNACEIPEQIPGRPSAEQAGDLVDLVARQRLEAAAAAQLQAGGPVDHLGDHLGADPRFGQGGQDGLRRLLRTADQQGSR